MALTFTIAGLQTQLQLIATAIDSGDFVSAKAEHAKALVLLTGLPEDVSSGEHVVKMRKNLSDLLAAIDSAHSVSSTTDRRRLIQVGLGHSTNARRCGDE
ncbi:hypothetical protein KW797_02355 [Candidatus Parcubacteria bacterium]|nr:hypothetical protein [Candidatus Parcubacteria bacterium]